MDDSPALGPHPQERDRSLGRLIVGVVLLAVIVIGFSFFFSQRPPASGDRAGVRALLHQGTTTLWYEIDGSVLKAVPGPVGFDEVSLRVAEAAPALATKEVPVLVREGQYDLLGLVRGDGSLLPLVDDKTHKEGLAVRSDGLAAFSFLETGATASPPQSWKVMTLRLYARTAKAHALGTGYGAQFAKDGSILALGPEGLVRIDASNGARGVLIAREGALSEDFALSPDASYVLITNPVSSTLDLFAIKNPKPARVSYLGSVKGIPSAVAFIDATHFLVQTSLSAATEYQFSAQGVGAATPLTISYDQNQ